MVRKNRAEEELSKMGLPSKWRDVLKEISKGSVLYLMLLIKHVRNRTETRFFTFGEDMKKRAARSVLQNTIRIQRDFVKLEIVF